MIYRLYSRYALWHLHRVLSAWNRWYLSNLPLFPFHFPFIEREQARNQEGGLHLELFALYLRIVTKFPPIMIQKGGNMTE